MPEMHIVLFLILSAGLFCAAKVIDKHTLENEGKLAIAVKGFFYWLTVLFVVAGICCFIEAFSN